MFSRAAKSVAKSFRSPRIHISEKNFKPSWIIMVKEPCSTKISHPNVTINNARTDNNIAHNLSNLQGNNGKSQTDELVEALYRLPIAEEASTLNSALIPNEIIPKAYNVCSRMYPYVRIINEMDPSSKTWQRDYTIAAICKWYPDLIYLPFQEHDISFISESKNFKNHQSIKRKKRNQNLFRVAKNNYFLANYKKSATELIEECRNAKIFSHVEIGCKSTGKSTNWVINWIKSKLLHEIHNYSQRYMSWFFNKAFAVNDVSINLINNYLPKKIIGTNGKTYFFINCKNNDTAVALNRNSKAVTGDTLNTVEEENWIQRTSCKIKSILPDLHAKIRSRSTTVLNLYCSENIFAMNESIPIFEVISNRIFFASKDCDSKSRIRRKIEEFCIQRKKSLRKKVDRDDDICKKRERSCKTAEKKCQERKKTCGKKEVDCSKRNKRTCKEQRKVSCKERKDFPDKEDARDCRKTREAKPQEELSKSYKDCDTTKTEEDFCQKQRCVKQEQTSCSRSATKQTEKDTCKKSKKDEYHKPYDKSDKCTKEKKCGKEEDEKASCKQRQKKTCQEKKKTDYEEEKKSKKSECSEIRKIEQCKKKECPPVTKAPDCSDSNGKTKENEKICRKYSTYALQNY